MNFTYGQDTSVYVAGIVASANSPSYTGRAPTAYSISPALPAGLTINATTGVIGGNPSAASTAANYTVTGANATDTVTKVLRITVLSAAGENYANTSFPNKRAIYLNTQGNGANVPGNVLNFPVLVRLDSAIFNTGFTQTLAGGADVRFTKSNNTTRHSHQIERWDAAAKRAEIWVLVDTVKGNRVDSIRMHWGNATAPNLSSGPAVFDTTNGFEAVWHMSGASGSEADATVNGFTASSGGNEPVSAAAGAQGPARQFNGTSPDLTVPGAASGRLSFTLEQSYTLSGWVNPAAISTATGTGHKIVEKGDHRP
jgi:hypothetical protein